MFVTFVFGQVRKEGQKVRGGGVWLEGGLEGGGGRK